MAFVFFVPDAKPVVVSERDDQLREGLVRDAAVQLAVQRIHRCLTQGIAVNVFDGAPQRIRIEQRAFDVFRIVLEPIVRAKPRARGPTELTAHLFFLAGNVLCGFANQIVVGLVARQGRRIGHAGGNAQNLELALGHAIALAVHPRQGIVPLRGTHIHQRALGSLWRFRICHR